MFEEKNKPQEDKLVEKIVYNILLFIVNFFIDLGEATKYLLFLPFKILIEIFKYSVFIVKRIIESIFNIFLNIFLNFKKLIVSIKNFFIKILKSIRSFKFKPFKKKKIKKIEKKIIIKEPIIIKNQKQIFTNLKVFDIKSFIYGFFLAVLIFFINNSYNFVKSLPSPEKIGKINYSLTTHITDRNGTLLYDIYRGQNRTPVKLADMPKYVYQASIAIEDKNFYQHNGVSPFGGIIRALKETILKKNLQGGSTITQQLVKSALLSPERTIRRKIKEIILALWTERIYTKNEILEMYLNQVPYGGSSYGIEEASKTYFSKSAKNLNLSEAALLAGLPQAPSLYSPFLNPKLSKERRNQVLKNMLEEHFITDSQYNASIKTSLNISSPKTTIKAPHFVFYVKNILEKEYGIRTVEEGGLRVTTSLDWELQKQIEDILSEEINNLRNLNVTNGAVLVTKPNTGEILAMVGSVDYFSKPYGAYNVTTALRQPGSSIKPIMYSLALQNNYTTASIIDDSPVVFSIPGTRPYRPVNYDGKFHGRVTLRYALANSFNVPAVKVLNTIGVNNFIDYAKKLGIDTWIDPSRYGLSLTLGGGEVLMTDMAEAFGVFANEGRIKELNPILKIINTQNNLISENDLRSRRVIDPGISYIISDILSDNTARSIAFGRNSSLEIPGYKVSVKTGTTDEKKDNWTIGYTPEFLVTVWVGNNDNTPMNPYLTSGITGAAPIWNKIMALLLKKYSTKNTWFEKPNDIVEKTCFGGKKEYFLSGTENLVNCSVPPIITISPTPTQ